MSMFRQRYRDERATTMAQQMVRSLHERRFSDQTIADLIAATPGTVNKIRHGHQSGRNLERRLSRLCETINRNYAEAGIS
jgi:hypothetical protein